MLAYLKIPFRPNMSLFACVLVTPFIIILSASLKLQLNPFRPQIQAMLKDRLERSVYLIMMGKLERPVFLENTHAKVAEKFYFHRRRFSRVPST